MDKEKSCNLIEAFDAIGQSIYGNDWTEKEKNFYKNQNDFNKYNHEAYNVLSVLEDLIKNHFFDVYNKKTKSFLDKDKQNLDLLSQEISYTSFLKKKIPFTEFEALEGLRTGKYSNKPISTYSLPNNFLIPKEQFDYVLKACRRWVDQEPKGSDGLIISEYRIIVQEFENQYKTIDAMQRRQVKVDDWNNLISYFELKEDLKRRLKLEDFEIDFLIDCEFSGSAWSSLDEPIILEGDIGKSGYMNAYLYDGRKGNSRYHNTFYLKSQIDKFKSSTRFIKYEDLVKKWNNFGAEQDAVINLIADYIIKNPNCEIANLSVFKLDGLVLSGDKVEKDKTIISSCIIKNTLIDKLEKKHFSSFLEKKKNLKETIKHIAPEDMLVDTSNKEFFTKKSSFKEKRIKEILATRYLTLSEFGDFLGYRNFKDWDFQEIITAFEGHSGITNFFKIYHNDIHLRGMMNQSIDFAPPDHQIKQGFKIWGYGDKKFCHFQDCLTYHLILNISTIPQNLKNDFVNGDRKNCNEDELFVVNRANGLVELVIYNHLKDFIDPEIFEFLENLNCPKMLPHEARLSFRKRNKVAMKFTFDLLRNSRTKLIPYLKNSPLLNFFPCNSCIGIENIFERDYQRIFRYLEIKELVYRTIFLNEEVECFFQDSNGVYRKIVGLGKAYIPLGHTMFFATVKNIAFDKGDETLLMQEDRHIYVSMNSTIKFVESRDVQDATAEVKLSELVSSQGVVKTNQKSVDDVGLWEKFIKYNLKSNFNKADTDYAKQAANAYNSLTKTQKENLKYFDVKKKCFKKTAITTDLLYLSKDHKIDIGKSSINTYITLPFVKKLSNHSNH